MYKPTMSVIKDLRSRTGAGIKDCKTALQENNGDFDSAIDWLRTKGIAKAAKKAGRAATEGIIHSAVNNGVGALVEVNCETDFVARTDGFKGFVTDLVNHLLANKPADNAELMSQSWHTGDTVEAVAQQMVFKTGENVQLRRFEIFASSNILHSYIHTGARLGVLVEISADNQNDAILEFADDLSMHIAATRPEFVSSDEIPQAVVDKEFAIQKARVMEEGKPEKIAEKVVMGRIGKWKKEISLIDQPWMHDDAGKLPVKQVVKDLSATHGNVSIVRFTTFELGEGLEKKANNFAEEVAQMSNQ